MAKKKVTTTTIVEEITEDDTSELGSGPPYLALVVDRSGSVESIWPKMKEGIAKFLTEQRATPGLLATIVAFDDEYKVLAENKPIGEISPTVFDSVRPRGNTALLDAVGKTVATIDQLPQKPSKVLFVVHTDGWENSSQEYQKKQVADTMTKKRAGGWATIYLGAEEAAWAGRDAGFGPAISFAPSAAGSSLGAVSSTATSYYAGQVSSRGVNQDVINNAQAGEVTLTTEPAVNSTP